RSQFCNRFIYFMINYLNTELPGGSHPPGSVESECADARLVTDLTHRRKQAFGLDPLGVMFDFDSPGSEMHFGIGYAIESAQRLFDLRDAGRAVQFVASKKGFHRSSPEWCVDAGVG